MSNIDTLRQHLHTLRMPTAVQIVEELLATGLRDDWSLETFLLELLEQEMEGRSQRRIERLQKAAHLPGKPWRTLTRSICRCAFAACCRSYVLVTS
jgi:DNA replication protein DnaC